MQLEMGHLSRCSDGLLLDGRGLIPGGSMRISAAPQAPDRPDQSSLCGRRRRGREADPGLTTSAKVIMMELYHRLHSVLPN
jgi:hypothetical protein